MNKTNKEKLTKSDNTKRKALTGRKKALYEALKCELGVVTTACETVKVSRETHYQWLKTDPNYKSWVEEMPDLVLDFSETALLKKIKGGNVPSIIFHLKTKGKSRGYVERQEVEHSGETEVKVTGFDYIVPDEGKNKSNSKAT